LDKLNGTVAHPGFTKVKLRGGEYEGKVRPWTMAQRAEIKPALGAILERVESMRNGREVDVSLPTLFLKAENEIAELCRISVELPVGVSWDDLFWEDLANIAQAVWETNIVTGNGGGLAGKLLGLLSPFLGQPRGAAPLEELTPSENAALNSPLPMQPTPRPQG